MPISQMRKFRHRNAKSLVQETAANKDKSKT